MQEAVRVVATVIVVVGLGLILWRELAAAEERRKVGRARDVVEVLLPIVAAAALVIWVWI